MAATIRGILYSTDCEVHATNGRIFNKKMMCIDGRIFDEILRKYEGKHVLLTVTEIPVEVEGE